MTHTLDYILETDLKYKTPSESNNCKTNFYILWSYDDLSYSIPSSTIVNISL